MAEAVSIFYSEAFLAHDTGQFHPENPGRLTAVVVALKAATFADKLHWRSPPALDAHDPLPAIHEVHNLHYLSDLESLADSGGGLLDPDTPVSPPQLRHCVTGGEWLVGGGRYGPTGWRARLCFGSAAGAPCHQRSRHGLLLAVQCGDRGPLRRPTARD
jgi:hypothetical protein